MTRKAATHAHSNYAPGAVLALMSADRKLSPVTLEPNTTKRLRPTPRVPYCSSTYVSIEATCPDHCAFRNDGCYAQAGFTGGALRRMDREARAAKLCGDDVIANESELIDRAFLTNMRRGVPQDGARGGRDLRLHVGGDVASEDGARMLASSAIRWRLRGGGTVWTYTHRWTDVSREAWGPDISVLASVESVEDAHYARELGYAPAIVVDHHAGERAYELREGKHSLTVVPCPQQTRGVTCVECRLCLDRPLFEMGLGIAFAVHGTQVRSAKRRLPVLTSGAA